MVFYIVEGGGSNRLIRTTSGSDGGGSFNVYETKNYQFWKIKYYPYPERWDIVKENGFKYVYGDQSSGRSTIQYVVRWENWIGSSSQTSGQSQMATTWNLSEIVNLQGEKILFEYDNIEQFVGSGDGRKHTEASYLKQITDVIGRKIQFVYNYNYTPCTFHSFDARQIPIYHTNVMMCITKELAVVCWESIQDGAERKQLEQTIEATRKQVIEISLAQVDSFAGNMLQVQNQKGQCLMVMSSQAFQSLTTMQVQKLTLQNKIIHSPLYTIERHGGGSARCMVAEVF
ncbi:MAG: arginine deiminase-related protein [Cytophagales bacterium]